MGNALKVWGNRLKYVFLLFFLIISLFWSKHEYVMNFASEMKW